MSKLTSGNTSKSNFRGNPFSILFPEISSLLFTFNWADFQAWLQRVTGNIELYSVILEENLYSRGQ